ELIEFINRTNPEIISSKPNILNIFMENSQRLGLNLKFRPKLIVSSGAMLENSLRSQLESYFETKVKSSYNITELGHIGSECPHNYIHFDSTNIYVEILDEEGNQVKEG